jgi:hypothetical protein
MWNRFLAAALLFAILPQAQARDTSLPVIFGPEFTFIGPTPTTSIDINGAADIIARQYEHLVEGQPEGAKFMQTGHDSFRSPNGWSFTTSHDPGVVEVQMEPMTWPEYAHYASDIQDAIFASAANKNYFPALFMGGGHINIGIDLLIGHSRLLFRNLLADLINHSELFMGILGYDTHNALPFPFFSPQLKAKIVGQFELFDRGAINLNELVESIDSLQSDEINDDFMMMWHTRGSRGKFTGFNLALKSENGRRLELRGVRPQASMDVWVRQIRLLAKRIEFLRKKRRPIAVEPIVVVEDPVDAEKHFLNPPVNPREALHAFHQYVIESGERWQDHKDYLWPRWITDGEVRRYERTKAFRDLERQRCAQALELENVD